MSDPAQSFSDADGDRTEVGSPGALGQTIPHGYEPNSQVGVADPKFAAPREAGEVGRLGRFRVLKKLGAGGMGAVYLGYDETLERTVALKVLLPAQAAAPGARERFLREARAAAKVKSDHVVTIFDVGDEDGHPFIAMEHLVGSSLERYLVKQGELPLAQALRVVRETALGLSVAHEQGLIHRDIKPGNLWLESPHGRVKILDFGLARVAAEDVHLTDSGAVVGTPAYMSPEQGRGHAVDHRSDLFSLGAVLYRLVTGNMPFPGDTTMAVLSSLALDTPAPVRQINPELPQALESLIAKLLTKKPEGRFQTALEVAEALRVIEQPLSGPAVVPVALRVEPQALNVWEGIEATEVGLSAPATDPDPISGPRPAAPAPVVRPPRRPAGGRVWPVLLAGAALLAAGALLAGVLARLSQGKLIVESDDPDAELVIKRNGAVVRDRTKDREITLHAGTYTAELADPKQGLRLALEKIEIPWGGTTHIRVVLERPRPPVVKPTPPPATPDRKAAEYALKIGGSLGIAESDNVVQNPAQLPNGPFTLTSWNAAGTPVTDAGLEVFKDCTNLVGLDFRETQVSDAGLVHFKNCKKLTHLTLVGTKVTDAGLVHFKDCPNLLLLDLAGTQVTGEGLASFKGCQKLTQLNLTGVRNVGDAGLAHFKGCLRLTNVSVPDTGITDAGLAHLKSCTRVWELSVAGNGGITDAGLAHLREWTNLKLLFLDHTAVTDSGFVHLKGCKGLTDLNLTGTKVTDAGLAHFKDRKELRMLSVWGTAVTDAGIGAFRGCPQLAELDVRLTKVSPRMVAELAKALPRCRIVHDRGTIEPKN